MADDGAVDEDTRVALRELAQRAEWTQSGTGDDDARAGAERLRELGRDLAARVRSGDPGGETWAHRAVIELAEYCQDATASWSADDEAKLARLQQAAVIALAPPPGQADPAPARAAGQPRGLTTGLTLPGGRRRAVVAGIAVAGCIVVAAGIVAALRAGSHGIAPEASVTTTAAPAASTLAPVTSSADGTSSAPGTSSVSATSSTSETSSASATSNPSTSSPAGTSQSQVTAIQMTANPADGYPEVQIYGTVTTSGTGDVTVTVTVAGASGAPQTISSDDESGQRSYALSKTIYLQPWCGQKSVTVTVSSGAVAKSAAVPVSGC